MCFLDFNKGNGNSRFLYVNESPIFEVLGEERLE